MNIFARQKQSFFSRKRNQTKSNHPRLNRLIKSSEADDPLPTHALLHPLIKYRKTISISTGIRTKLSLQRATKRSRWPMYIFTVKHYRASVWVWWWWGKGLKYETNPRPIIMVFFKSSMVGTKWKRV